MNQQIIIAGSGGQGIMLLGKVIAEAAMREKKHVTWLPAYGAEVRGGTAHCMVVISDSQIGSPYVESADTLIIMNHPSLDKFRIRIKQNGLMIINSSLVKSSAQIRKNNLAFPFTDLAVELGNIKTANMIALGCYLGKSRILRLQTVLRVIEDIAPADKKNLVGINKQAINIGARLIK